MYVTMYVTWFNIELSVLQKGNRGEYRRDAIWQRLARRATDAATGCMYAGGA